MSAENCRAPDRESTSMVVEVDRGVVTKPPSNTAGGRVDEGTLMDRIGALIDKKLEDLRLEIFRAQLLRPPLGTRPSPTSSNKPPPPPLQSTSSTPNLSEGRIVVVRSSSTGGEKKRKTTKKKKKKKKEQQSQDLPPTRVPPSHTQVAEKSTPAAATQTWAQVVGRRAKATGRPATGGNNRGSPYPPLPPTHPERRPAPEPGKKREGRGGKAQQASRKIIPGRPPRTAAITLTIKEGSRMTYSEAMLKAREHIKLSDLGIAEIRPKRAITGGLILEIPGTDGAAKADALAAKMSVVLEGTDAHVARPLKRAELRVAGLIDSVTVREVVAAVALSGGCLEGEIHAGEIRMSPSGLGSLWLRCPSAAARKLAEAGHIQVGWGKARVEALAARPLQCYRCLEKGHVRQRCTAGVDRSGRCYACGETGHKASACTASAPRCPLCADLGRPANHRLGGPACSPPSRKGKGAKKSAPQAAKAKEGEEARPVEVILTSTGKSNTAVAEKAAAVTEAGPEDRASTIQVVESVEAGPQKGSDMEVEQEPVHEKRGLEGVESSIN